MEKKELFRIGEVAKMYHLSMGTLRHYEKEGILTPEYTDEKTGYRYYSVRQLEVLNTIRYLRVLELPLSQIGEFLQNREIDTIEKTLTDQQELIRQKQKELEIISKKIDHRLEQIRDAVSSRCEQIEVKRLPSSRIVWIRDSLRPNNYLDLEYSIQKLQEGQTEPLAFLGKVGVGISQENLEQEKFEKYDLVFLLLDEEDLYNGNIEQVPEQDCVTIRFCGGHSEAEKYYQKLFTFIKEQNYQIDGFAREITLIDYGLTNDTKKFVTEIQIPVRKKEVEQQDDKKRTGL